MPRLEDVRGAVADELERRGHPNREFIADIREGRRDDGPFMIGALAIAERPGIIR
jgi:hypothetical protein